MGRSLVAVDQLPNDPNIRQAIAEAQAAGGGGSKWPGATLSRHRPAHGAGEPHRDRSLRPVSNRIQTAFDSRP